MALFHKILVIQTAFIGDVVLATAVVEKLAEYYPASKIDFLLRKGNERLLDNNPHLNKVLIWDKKTQKYKHLFQLILHVRKDKYDLVVNLQRYFSTGLLTAFSGAKISVCFENNPLSILTTHKIAHEIGGRNTTPHEVERNLSLIAQWTDNQFVKPKIYPAPSDFDSVKFEGKYLTISPASVWFTKQFPKAKWLDFMDRVGEETTIFLLGGPSDLPLCNELATESRHRNTIIKAGELSFLQSAALMKNSAMNFVNDSAPLHFASAVDAPVTAIFCSTVKKFGFVPLSTNSAVLETTHDLPCRPCGLHGKKSCPERHFRCSNIEIERLLERL